MKIDRIKEIAEMVSLAYDVSVEDMRKRGRTEKYLVPRRVAMYLVRMSTHFSLSDIGAWFGGRDHSTVINAVDRVSDLMEIYPRDREKVTRLLNAVLQDRNIGDGAPTHIHAPSGKEVFIVVNTTQSEATKC